MQIRLLPDGTKEEQERMARSAGLAMRIDAVIAAQQLAEAHAIEALGLLFAVRAKSPEQVTKYATDIATAISVCYSLKEKANGQPIR